MTRCKRHRTDIICMDTGEQMRLVVRIDVEAGIVWRHHDPLRVDLLTGNGVAEYATRFRSIYPIHAGDFYPHLVHCYGRLDGKATDAKT